MEKITVWTKQRKAILQELEEQGYHVTKREHVAGEWEEHANLVLEVYDWLVRHTPGRVNRPEYAEYPES